MSMSDITYNSAFISDVHLSTVANNTDDILHFLHNFQFSHLYIVGDFIDLWKLKTLDHWPDNHTTVLKAIVDLMSGGVKVTYVVGNHDEFFHNFIGNYNNLEFCDKTSIEIGSKKLLVLHGHQFDWAIKYLKFFGIIGTGFLDAIHRIEQWLNNRRQKKGKEPFSLSEKIKEKTKESTEIKGKFEKLSIEYAQKKGMDGVICGHTHDPALKAQNNMIYANTGDFVSNSTFMLAHENKLQLLRYNNGEAFVVETMEL